MNNKLISYFVSIFLGIAISLVGGFLQAAKSKFFINIPWGFALYLIVFFLAIRFIRRNYKSRFALICFSFGWLTIALLMSTKLQAGDLVLTNNIYAIIYLIGSVIILGAMTTLPIKK